jgi:hypothetical protein
MIDAKEDPQEDDFIRLQLEDKNAQETLMVVDSVDLAGGIRIIATFSVALIAITLFGIFGPPAVKTQSSPYQPLHHGDAVEQFKLRISPLSSLNRFLRVYFVLVRSDTRHTLNGTLQYRCHFSFRKSGGSSVLKSAELETVPVRLRRGRTTTGRILLLSDNMVTYSEADVRLELRGALPGISRVQIGARYGNVRHTYFQMAFCVVFALSALTCSRVMLRALSRTPIGQWHFEQKLTLPLIVFAFSRNNPMFCLYVRWPTRIYVIFDTIAKAVFAGYLRLFILALFDCLRFKGRKVTTAFFLPKLAIVLALFASSIVHGIYDNIVGKHNVDEGIHGTELVLTLVYIGWAAMSILRAGVAVDVTERHKFNLYAAAGGAAIATMALVQLLLGAFATLRHSSVRFVVAPGAESLFALLMAYCHWPYDVLQRKRVRQATEQADITENEDTRFFVDA